MSFAPAHQLLKDEWVDGFFAVSGFLITWSWFSALHFVSHAVSAKVSSIKFHIKHLFRNNACPHVSRGFSCPTTNPVYVW